LNETAPTPHPEYPKALRDADERARRQALLGDDHVAPLVAYGTQLAERTGKAVPVVDPLDGGVNARLLILLETPGPRGLGQFRRQTAVMMIRAGLP
jgi:uracil-DNA glycosylase